MLSYPASRSSHTQTAGSERPAGSGYPLASSASADVAGHRYAATPHVASPPAASPPAASPPAASPPAASPYNLSPYPPGQYVVKPVAFGSSNVSMTYQGNPDPSPQAWLHIPCTRFEFYIIVAIDRWGGNEIEPYDPDFFVRFLNEESNREKLAKELKKMKYNLFDTKPSQKFYREYINGIITGGRQAGGHYGNWYYDCTQRSLEDNIIRIFLYYWDKWIDEKYTVPGILRHTRRIRDQGLDVDY